MEHGLKVPKRLSLLTEQGTLSMAAGLTLNQHPFSGGSKKDYVVLLLFWYGSSTAGIWS